MNTNKTGQELPLSAANQIEFSQGGGTGGGTADVEVVRHWTRLLENAERLHTSGEYEVAIVVAQTACEVITERAISKAFGNKGVAELESPVTGFLISYNLGNERVRKLYDALAGDTVAGEGFWEAFKALAKTRNESVHSGRKVSETESRDGLDAASQLVAHIEQKNGLT